MGSFMGPVLGGMGPELVRRISDGLSSRAATEMPADVQALQAPPVQPSPPVPAPGGQWGPVAPQQMPALTPYLGPQAFQPPRALSEMQLRANAVSAVQQTAALAARAETSAATNFWIPVVVGVAGGLGLIGWAVSARGKRSPR